MLVSARTAPKLGGVDDTFTTIVYGAEKESLVAEMERIAEERGISGFRRDADNVGASEAVVLIGVRERRVSGLTVELAATLVARSSRGRRKKLDKTLRGRHAFSRLLTSE